MNKSKILLLVYLKYSVFLVMAFVCQNLQASNYEIRVTKSSNSLKIIKENKIVKRFSISVGRGGAGDKRMVGDKKTPIGVYYVTRLKNSNKFHYFFGINYPNLKDGYHGYKRKIITLSQFKAIKYASEHKKTPPQNTRLGGAIGIHGIGKQTRQKLLIHKNINWTEGCIAVENHEIEELKKFIRIGTKVRISE